MSIKHKVVVFGSGYVDKHLCQLLLQKGLEIGNKEELQVESTISLQQWQNSEKESVLNSHESVIMSRKQRNQFFNLKALKKI